MKIYELGKDNIKNGKAGLLNTLYNEFNIARGFIIKSAWLKEFMHINNISLDDEYDTIKTKIMNGIFPDEDILLRYFKKHNYKSVIVRSSASYEDGDDYSFAGQFSSLTNTDIDSLVLNIKKCLLSYFSKNIKAYLDKSKIKENFSFDILVQEMIVSNISGIAFSINPTSLKKEVLVEVTDLQCEDLVSGRVKPHTYKIPGDLSDCFLSKEKLDIINNNILKLKKILKKELEIEFCFKDGLFYLLQVRPITKTYFSLNNYIKEEFWCCFKNNNWTLFTRSLWIMGARDYKNKIINNEITEDITLYLPHNEKQIRAFNSNQPPLDDITTSKCCAKDIDRYINSSYDLASKIKKLSNTTKRNIKNNDFKSFKTNLKKIIKYNAIINSYEYLIGSLGNALSETLNDETLKNIERWRNDEDNSYFSIYNDIFEYVYSYFKINIDIEQFKMYTSVFELISLCDGKLKSITLIKRIKKREKDGFVLLNLNNKKYCNKVITDKITIKTVKNRFQELQSDLKKCEKGIKGNSTFKNGKVIEGECVVIKDNNTDIRKLDLNGKILVCDVTTAKDVAILENVKALIVNSGGILCHSAIFSREFNIPCLMGCEIATEYFNTGDKIYFDIDKEIADYLDV